ncbi:MAG: 30S ribosomal protein S1 [Candidatus Marinimicrobia bacterium]|nr:30S ribosomal protein S1 [Candidatus Neomarinimicrobiota bacterium]
MIYKEEDNIQEEAVVSEEVDAQEEAVVSEEVDAQEEAVVSEEVDAQEEAVVSEEVDAQEEAVVSEDSNDETKAEAKDIVDYLSSDILEIRQVNEEDLIDTNVEEKFILNEDLVVNVRKNNIVNGNVVNVSDRDVFIDIGFKTEGIVPLSEFKNPPIIGKELEVVVEKFEDTKGNLLLSKEKADFIKRWNSIKEAHDNEETINGTIVRRIKGGMVVDLDVIQAFLPGSQIDIKPVTDFDEYLGKEFEFKIVKINELRKNVVLSRKELLATDLKEKRKKVIEEMEQGMVLEGIVKNITDFGAFIDLGGIDGLLHITDITWGRINHPSEKLEIGQSVQVKVIDFDLEKVRVSLGMKQLTDEPWKDVGMKYPIDSQVNGKVVNMMNYGLFIELEEGIEGLIHISEISWTKHIKHPSEVYNIGDEITAKVLSIEEQDRKISLGVKQLSSNPWDEIESNYKVGDVHKGIVKNLTQFGAFVNLNDSIDGLLHISDMSWTKMVKHPNDFLSIGDEIEVKILEVSSDDKKVSLGVKQLQENPWDTLSDFFTSGKNIKGKAINVTSKSVIFELEHDVEGVLNTTNKEAFSIGNDYDLTVQGIDMEAKKVIIMDDGVDLDTNSDLKDEDKPASEDSDVDSNDSEDASNN